MPWVNVLANPHFGTIVTASGSAHTWSENSRENRLTPFAVYCTVAGALCLAIFALT